MKETDALFLSPLHVFIHIERTVPQNRTVDLLI